MCSAAQLVATGQNKVAVNWNRNALKQQTFKVDVNAAVVLLTS